MCPLSLSCTQIEERLIKRLHLSITAWTECLCGVSSEGGGVDTSMDTTPSNTPTTVKLGGTPQLEVQTTSIIIIIIIFIF